MRTDCSLPKRQRQPVPRDRQSDAPGEHARPFGRLNRSCSEPPPPPPPKQFISLNPNSPNTRKAFISGFCVGVQHDSLRRKQRRVQTCHGGGVCPRRLRRGPIVVRGREGNAEAVAAGGGTCQTHKLHFSRNQPTCRSQLQALKPADKTSPSLFSSVSSVYRCCTRAHSPHPPAWPGRSFPKCVLVVHLRTRRFLLSGLAWPKGWRHASYTPEQTNIQGSRVTPGRRMGRVCTGTL